MERTKKITVILTLAIAFCFGLVSLAQAIGWKRWIPLWAKNNLENSQKAVSIPIWKITQNGTAESVQWIDHAPNTRFAIYDPNGDSDPDDLTTLSDDLVLDKETGLIWARDANTGGEKMWWPEAILFCRQDVQLGNRLGWRIPTIEELSSLIDPSQSDPTVPNGNPFINVQYWQSGEPGPSVPYWSSTTYEYNSAHVWVLHMHNGQLNDQHKGDPTRGHVWPVRGGNGYATGVW